MSLSFKRTSTVYYSGFPTEADNLTLLEPEPLLKSVAKEWAGKDAENLLHCPAMTQDMKNTYVIRAPLTITVSWDDEKGWHFTNKDLNQLSQTEFDKLFLLTPGSDNKLLLTLPQLFIDWGSYLFFADEPTLAQIQPANYHETKFSKFPFITGSFEIDKWCRPISFGIINQKKEDIVIQRNDPLYYIKFFSKKDVVLKRFSMTAEILSIITGSLTIKKFLKGSSMRRLYEMFMQSGNKKRILREINKQFE
tara:strand:- start:17 stop:766 length:750 start_codon:yes stop_codon:yes gene_type:complete